jgi:hypothetical protein
MVNGNARFAYFNKIWGIPGMSQASRLPVNRDAADAVFRSRANTMKALDSFALGDDMHVAIPKQIDRLTKWCQRLQIFSRVPS